MLLPFLYRNAIGAIFVRLLALGADPNSVHPSPREPSLAFKVDVHANLTVSLISLVPHNQAVFMREVNLANALFEVGGGQQDRDPQSVLNLLVCPFTITTKEATVLIVVLYS